MSDILDVKPPHVYAAISEVTATAGECRPDQPVIRARWLQAAQTIDRLIEMLESAYFVAKLNHETIRGMAQR